MSAHGGVQDCVLRPVPSVRRPWVRVALAGIRRMMKVARGRRRLAMMDDRLLADIGVSRGEALFEASRAPWDVKAWRDSSRMR